jgi:hypothetical protein
MVHTQGPTNRLLLALQGIFFRIYLKTTENHEHFNKRHVTVFGSWAVNIKFILDVTYLLRYGIYALQ